MTNCIDCDIEIDADEDEPVLCLSCAVEREKDLLVMGGMDVDVFWEN